MPFLSALAAALGTSGFGRGGNLSTTATGPFTTQVFTTAGSFTIPQGVSSIEYVIIAGGGGGGGNNNAGGGGAGGIRLGSNYPVTAGKTYNVQVGGGGVASYPYRVESLQPSHPSYSGVKGGNSGGGSYIEDTDPITSHLGANGGGKGGGPSDGATNGGCGGGGGYLATGKGRSLTLTTENGHSGSLTGENVDRGQSIQGFDGADGNNSGPAYGSGGGGGASQTGFAGTPSTPYGSTGGNGIVVALDITREVGGGGGGGSSLSGNPNGYQGGVGGVGGGGNGAAYSRPSWSDLNNQGESALPGTGGGGGGAAGFNIGGHGGSGLVIVKYQTESTGVVVACASSRTVTVPENYNTMEYLVLGGGGAGGRDHKDNGGYARDGGGGGGGAGGLRTASGISVNPGDNITVQVGAGGGINTAGEYPATARGDAGVNSFIEYGSPVTHIGSNGGGGGGNGSANQGNLGGGGGCGGGHGSGNPDPNNPAWGKGNTQENSSSVSADPNAYPDQGNRGGIYTPSNPNTSYFGGGGGGTAEAGKDGGDPANAGKGGNGTISSITGYSVCYGGGGGGSCHSQPSVANATPGIAGQGGNGGGGYGVIGHHPVSYNNQGPDYAALKGSAGLGGGGGGGPTGASGGSGTVILKFTIT